jgi:hypothetical protein
MTAPNLRTLRRKPTQMRKFATVPLIREPLTQRLWDAALNRRASVAGTTVSGLRFGYALNRRLPATQPMVAGAK